MSNSAEKLCSFPIRTKEQPRVCDTKHTIGVSIQFLSFLIASQTFKKTMHFHWLGGTGVSAFWEPLADALRAFETFVSRWFAPEEAQFSRRCNV